MNIKTAFFLAYTSIVRGNKGTLAMTILIMTLAYVNLVFVSSIFGGIVTAINTQSIENQYGNIVIEPAVDKIYIENSQAIESLEYIPGIQAISPHYIDNARIKYDDRNDGKDIKSGKWTIKSINPNSEKKVTNIYKSMLDGSFIDENDTNSIVIGKEIAGGYGGDLEYLSLGVRVGDSITITFSNGITRDYIVKGVFGTKSTAVDQMAFISQKEMESVLQVHNWASEIIIKTEKTGNEEKYIPRIRDSGFENADIKTWSSLMGFTASASSSFDMISIILGVIGTIVAGVTIFIIIFVSVVNKRRQIGILKAIGMKDITIILYFVMQALFYGLIGVVLGNLITLFAIEPFFINNPLDFPVGWVSLEITPKIIGISASSLMLSSLIGGFFPAYRGAKEDILSAMWG